jgi:hypothetical protein
MTTWLTAPRPPRCRASRDCARCRFLLRSEWTLGCSAWRTTGGYTWEAHYWWVDLGGALLVGRPGRSVEQEPAGHTSSVCYDAGACKCSRYQASVEQGSTKQLKAIYRLCQAIGGRSEHSKSIPAVTCRCSDVELSHLSHPKFYPPSQSMVLPLLPVCDPLPAFIGWRALVLTAEPAPTTFRCAAMRPNAVSDHTNHKSPSPDVVRPARIWMSQQRLIPCFLPCRYPVPTPITTPHAHIHVRATRAWLAGIHSAYKLPAIHRRVHQLVDCPGDKKLKDMWLVPEAFSQTAAATRRLVNAVTTFSAVCLAAQ